MENIIKTLIESVVGLLLDGLVVMLFWNWIIPDLFGLTTLNYGEGILLVIIGHALSGAYRKQ